MGPCRFHLPMVHEALPFPLVAAVQLSAHGGTGRWGHHRSVRYILFTANAAEWRNLRELVGKFCMEEYGGRAADSSQDARSGRNIWTEHVVVMKATRGPGEQISHLWFVARRMVPRQTASRTNGSMRGGLVCHGRESTVSTFHVFLCCVVTVSSPCPIL